ncbi:MAG: RNA polymerase sigma factor [Myxococcota bacterium]
MSEVDPDFVRALRAGAPDAFAHVVRLFTPRLRRMALRYFHSPFDQEEALQEVFALLFRQREAIDPLRADTLEPFVMTLAKRRMIDLVRQRGRTVALELSDPEELEWADEAPDPARAAADRELSELFERFEKKLKPAYRAYFHAVFVEGKDFDEARGALGLGTLRAKYLKSVLLRRLRQHGPLLEALGRRRGE